MCLGNRSLCVCVCVCVCVFYHIHIPSHDKLDRIFKRVSHGIPVSLDTVVQFLAVVQLLSCV